MKTIKEVLSSKRVWTIIVMFLVNGIAAISNMLPAGALGIINPILLALGLIFGIPGVKKS